MVGQQNADFADTLQPRDVAMATIFCLSIYGVYTGATWRIRLNRPCAAPMRPYNQITLNTRMWANAQPDGRPAENRWRPLFNAAVWLTPTTRCRAVTLPRRKTR